MGENTTVSRQINFPGLIVAVAELIGFRLVPQHPVLVALIELLERIRVAKSLSGGAVRTVALCPGAGGSVICSQAADLYLTGEMRHHDVLAANARGTSVILGEHSNTERGYLARFRELLLSGLGLDDIKEDAARGRRTDEQAGAGGEGRAVLAAQVALVQDLRLARLGIELVQMPV